MKGIMSKHEEAILKKQCEIVGANYDSIDFKSEFWFTEHKWTVEQENDFIEWLVDYWYNSKESRVEMLRYSFKNKKRLKESAKWWCFNFGWSYKKDEICDSCGDYIHTETWEI